MNRLTHHYDQLLEFEEFSEASQVNPELNGNCVEIRLTHRDGPVAYPECLAECSIVDDAPERSWRHLDTMRSETVTGDRSASRALAMRWCGHFD